MDNQSSGKVLGSKNWYHLMLHKSFLIESLAYGFCTVLFQTEVGDIDTIATTLMLGMLTKHCFVSKWLLQWFSTTAPMTASFVLIYLDR